MVQRGLDALGAPASISLAHVGGWFDRGDELEGNIDDANDADDGARDDPPQSVSDNEAAKEDVDYNR